MHKEQRAARLEVGIEAYRNNALDCMGDQFRGYPHLYHADKFHQIPNLGQSTEKYSHGSTSLNSDDDYWTPFQRTHSLNVESRHHTFDGYSSKRPDRSYTWRPGKHSDSTYGSQIGAGTTPSMSDSSCLDSRARISWTSDECSSYTDGVVKSRQPRTDSRELDRLMCNRCPWVGKTPSEKRKHEARHRKDYKCEEHDCDAKFATRNDLERHRKSVHKKCPDCGPKEYFKCFGRNCGHPEKVWPRLDNFKAHLRLKHYEQDEKYLLSQSHTWYNERKKEEEAKKISNVEGVNQSPSSGIDITPRREQPTTPTITPSKTLISSSNHNPSDYFDENLKKATLNPIEIPQSLSVNMPSENLQASNELPYSPLKAENLFALPRDWNLPSLPDILADVTPQRLNDSNLRRSEIDPSKGTLPGVESFDHVTPSTTVLNITAEVQNPMSELSREEKEFCFPIAVSTPSATYVETTGEIYEMGKEGLKKERFGCSLCSKSFQRPSMLKKHRKRHDKPYGCTFEGCYGRFGSKADWKRHESMQHGHTQSFRCSLRRDKRPQCAKVFLHQKDFVEHLNTIHSDIIQQTDHETIERQIAAGRIGANDAESRFTYWCGFCKKIVTVEKTGVDAQNERFDHIDLHFQKNANIKRWVPAKGHTEKGAQKRRDKNHKKECKRKATSHLGGDSESLYDNGYNDGEQSTYEECSSSEDETCTDVKPPPDSHGERNKSRKTDHAGKEFISCCKCGAIVLSILAVRCVECEHGTENCSHCQRWIVEDRT